MTEKKLSTLVINQVESLDVYNKLKAQGKINTDELYMISGEADQISGVKGDKETTYRTGNVNLTPEDIGALPDTTEIPTKVSELENDSGYAKTADLKTVAKTGNYNDLDNTPYISNQQITIKFRNKEGGTSSKVFTLNQSTAANIDIYSPTKLSEFENDSGFLTEHQSLADYAKTADLATVATTGSYNDLIQKPTIGDGEVSISYKNSSGGTTSSRFTLNDTGRHNINIYTPTKLSEFTNDTNYATQDELTNATAGLTGAMHFIGTATVAITDHATIDPVIDGYDFSAAKAGDVILYNHLEFVWDGAKWEQLGDEGSYVLKTQQINGKALSGDITLNAADVGALSTDSEFIVNLTQDSDGYYNPDKTFEETKAAIEANKKVYFYYSGAYIPVSFMRTSGPEIEIYASSFTIDSRGGFLGSFYWTPTNGFVEYYNNIVQEIDSSDTNEMIPTSKAVINYLDQEFNTVIKTMQKTSNLVNTINSTSTASTYPSAKAVYDFVQNNGTSATIITWSENVE